MTAQHTAYVEGFCPKKRKWRFEGPCSASKANKLARRWRKEGCTDVLATKNGPGPKATSVNLVMEQTRPEREAAQERAIRALMEW